MEKNYSLKKQQIETEAKPDLSLISGEKIQTADDKEPKYSVTINQFASFVNETDSEKKRIVNGQKNPPKKPFFWYQSAKSGIRKSVTSQEIKPIYDKINSLRKSKKDGVQKERNRLLSIEALETYLKISFPLKFKELTKEFIKPDIKHYNFYGLKIKVTPDIVFKGINTNGETVVGGIKLNVNKGKPFSKLRMKIVSTIIKRYLEKNVASEGEVVDGELCYCIDVFGKSVMQAPTSSSSPNVEIKEGAKEFAEIWSQIE